MPHLIVIEGHEGQRRQLEETLTALTREDRQVSGKFDADGTFPDWRALLERVGSRGLFAAREAVVAEGCEALGAFPDGLAGSLEGPEADAVIVATFGGEARKVFSKEVLALKKVRFLKAEASVPPWKRKDWLLKLAQEKGWRLAPDAALLLGESIESTEELRSELAKLALYADGREIALADIRALSFDEGGRALLTFLDGVCAGNAQDVARALSRLSRDPLLPVLTALCNRLRPALYIASFPGNEAQAAAAAGANREYAMRMARGALRLFGAEAVKDFMLRAVRLSFAEKTSAAQGWPGFELIVWDLLAGKAASPRGQPPPGADGPRAQFKPAPTRDGAFAPLLCYNVTKREADAPHAVSEPLSTLPVFCETEAKFDGSTFCTAWNGDRQQASGLHGLQDVQAGEVLRQDPELPDRRQPPQGQLQH